MVTLSIVVPAFNEEGTVAAFHDRLNAVLATLPELAEILYVNDGSTDGTLDRMLELSRQDGRVGILDLSRNFGKEIALSAGIDRAQGEAVVIIDADLQDPPEVIPAFVRKWREGYDVVYGRRASRSGDSWVKRTTARIFYRLLHRLGSIRIPEDAGDFRLLSRRAVDALKSLPEQHRYMKGLYAWIGFRQCEVPYHRTARVAGQTKWGYRRLVNLAVEGVTSFSNVPLQLSTYLGLAVAATSFGYGIWVIIKTLAYGEVVRGFPTLMVAVLFLGGTQLVAIGILGEYIGRMFDEAKRRPLYFVNAEYPPAAGAQGGSAACDDANRCGPASTPVHPLPP